MAVILEGVKSYIIWTRTLLIMILGILYFYSEGYTSISIVGLLVGISKLIETSLFQQWRPLQRSPGAAQAPQRKRNEGCKQRVSAGQKTS